MLVSVFLVWEGGGAYGRKGRKAHNVPAANRRPPRLWAQEAQNDRHSEETIHYFSNMLLGAEIVTPGLIIGAFQNCRKTSISDFQTRCHDCLIKRSDICWNDTSCRQACVQFTCLTHSSWKRSASLLSSVFPNLNISFFSQAVFSEMNFSRILLNWKTSNLFANYI